MEDQISRDEERRFRLVMRIVVQMSDRINSSSSGPLIYRSVALAAVKLADETLMQLDATKAMKEFNSH